MSQTSRDRNNSRRVRTHERNSGESGAGIRLNFWKQLGESRYPGALSPVLENFGRALSANPTDCPWVSEDGLLTTPVYSCRRDRFVNSALLNKKNLAQKSKFIFDKQIWKQFLQKFYVSSKKEKECYRKTTSYLEQQSRHFCRHSMRRTTQKSFLAINLASQQKTTKLYFPSQVRKQFKLLTVPSKPLRCCLRSDKLVNCHVWKFCKDLF